MAHYPPRGIYLDFWDLMREFDLEKDANDGGLIDTETSMGLGVTAGDFYIGMLSRLEGNPEGKFIAIELTARFITGLVNAISLVDGAENDEGEG